MIGKVVAVVGGPRCGKSHLVAGLAKYFNAPAFFEGEEHDFPAEIIGYCANDTHPVERYKFFREIVLANQIEASEMTKDHPLVFIDSSWFNMIPFRLIYKRNESEKRILDDLAENDLRTLPWPDVILYIKTDIETSRELVAKGGRSAEQTAEFFARQIAASKTLFDDFYKKINAPVPIRVIDRTGLEFDQPGVLERVIKSVPEFND